MFSRATAAAMPRGCRSATRDLSLGELSGGTENMPGACFPARPQRLCREDAAVRQEIYLLENCRAEQKTCRGHVFPNDRSGYAERMPQCDKRFISGRTVGRNRKHAGACFPARPQRLCREDAAVRQEIYLLENCRAEQKTCRGHVFPRDRSGYAARTPQCDKRFISWRTEAHDGRPSDRTSCAPSFWGRGSGSRRPSAGRGTRG